MAWHDFTSRKETAEMPELDDQAQTRLAIAALFAALVKALDRGNAFACSDFKDGLEEVSRDIRNNQTNATGALETLQRTSEFLK
jgi:DNA-binding IclR family transcriptional regulator